MANETRPTFMTKAERLQDAVAHGRLRVEILPVVDICEAHAAASEELSAQPFNVVELRRRQALIDQDFAARREAAIAPALAQAGKPLDAEEGTLRAKAKVLESRAEFPSDREWQAEIRAETRRRQLFERGQELASRAATAITAQEAADCYAEALLTESVEAIRTTGMVVRERLRTLTTANHADLTLQTAWLMHEEQFGTWQKTHPTATQRLAAIERERSSLELRVRTDVDHVVAMYGQAPNAIEKNALASAAAMKLQPVPDVGEAPGAIVVAPTLQRMRAAGQI